MESHQAKQHRCDVTLHAVEKKDVGYCGRLTKVWESALLGEKGGLNKKGLVLEMEVNIGVLI